MYLNVIDLPRCSNTIRVFVFGILLITPSSSAQIGSISGRVQKANGEGIPNLKLYPKLIVDGLEINKPICDALTDENGEFELQVEQGEYNLWIGNPREELFGPGGILEGQFLPHPLGRVIVGAAGHTRADYQAKIGASMRGRVVDSAGKPCVGWLVCSNANALGRRVRVGSDGAFTINGILPDQPCRIHFNGKDVRNTGRIIAGDLLIADQVCDIGDWNLVLLTGTPNLVIDVSHESIDVKSPQFGRPLLGYRSEGGIHEGTLDVRDGKISAELPPGKYTITFSLNRSYEPFERVVEIKDGEQTITTLVFENRRTPLPIPLRKGWDFESRDTQRPK